MPLELTLQVDDQNRVVAHCGADALTTPTPLADLPLLTAKSNPYRFAPEPLGQTLFAALGGPALLERLAATGDGLLLLNTDARAAAVPWEYAYTGSQFLACEVGFLRLLPTPAPALPQARGGSALTFIALAADPLVDDKGAPYRGLRLDVENELRKISAVLHQSTVQNTVALTAQRVPPLLSHLQRALRTGPALLHLSCHGSVQRISEYGVEKEVAFLALEDANGKLAQVRGDRLVNLAPRGVLRLIVLSACQSALSGEERTAGAPDQAEPTMVRADANLARALVRHGVPAAIGMQGNFPDALSDEFAATLYDSLLAGFDLGEALRQTRWRLRLAAPHAVGLPVAYVTPDGWAPLPLQEGRPQVRDMTPARYTRLPLSLQPPEKVVGRACELHQLALAFKTGQEDPALEQRGAQVVTVVGTGGIGKTVLAATFAARFGWRWPGGVIGVSLAELPTLRAATVLLALLERLGADTRALAELPASRLAELLLPALQERQCLLLIDNYESVLEVVRSPAAGDMDATGDEPALPGAAAGVQTPDADTVEQAQTLHQLLAQLAHRGVPCLLTSRQQPAGFVGEMVFPTPDQPLAGLDVAAGADLFFAHCPSAAGDRRQYTPLAQQVATVTEGHPLAIALLGGEYETSRHSVTPVQFLDQWGVELAAAYRPGLAPHHVTFAVAFTRSFRHLRADQQRQLLALGRFPAPFFAEGAALVEGEAPAEEATARAAQLARVRQRLGDLVQRSLLKIDARYSDSNLPATYRLDPVIQRELRRRTAMVTDHQVEHGYAAYAAWLVNRAYGQIGSDVGMARLMQQWLDELIIQAEQQPSAEQGWYCWRLGVMARQFGRLDDDLMLLAKGESAARHTDDEAALSRIATEQATVWVTRGDLDRALTLYEESLVLLEKLGDIKGKAASLHNMAQVFLTRGDLDRALTLYEESLVLKEKLGDLQGKAASFSGLANVQMARRDWAQAQRLVQAALQLEQQLGNPAGVAFNLVKLGQVAQAHGDEATTRQRYTEGLAIFERLGMPEANQVRAMLAAVEGNDGERPATVTPQQALLALVQAAAGKQHAPATVAGAAEQLAAAPDLPPPVAAVATALGAALRTPQAAQWAALATAATALLHDEAAFLAPNVVPGFLFALAHLFDRHEQPDSAVHFQTQAIDQLRQAGDEQSAQEAVSIALYNQAGYLANAGRLAEAVAALEEVVTIDERFGLTDLESDRQTLTAMRLRQAGGAPSPNLGGWGGGEAQLANLAPEEQAQMSEAMAAFARLSADEQAALAQAAQQQQINNIAQQAVDAALLAVRNDQVAALLPQLAAAAGHFAADEEAGSPYVQVAHFIQAVAAQLAGELPPAIPAAHVERWLAFQQALADNH